MQQNISTFHTFLWFSGGVSVHRSSWLYTQTAWGGGAPRSAEDAAPDNRAEFPHLRETHTHTHRERERDSFKYLKYLNYNKNLYSVLLSTILFHFLFWLSFASCTYACVCFYTPSSVMSRASTVSWMGIALSCVWHTRSRGQSLLSPLSSFSQSPAAFPSTHKPSAPSSFTAGSSLRSSFSFPSSPSSWVGNGPGCDVSLKWKSLQFQPCYCLLLGEMVKKKEKTLNWINLCSSGF